MTVRLELVVLVYFLLLALSAQGSAPEGPWDEFNYAPASRTVRPTSIYEVVGEVHDASALTSETGKASIKGNLSWVTVDFGKEVSTVSTLIIEEDDSLKMNLLD